MPEKSDITFLIFACVIISWPLRMPPRSRPMITSTIAISTRVKPFALDFISVLTIGVLPSWFSQGTADEVGVGAVFGVGRAADVRRHHRVRPGLQLAAHAAADAQAVVHLRVDRDGDLVGQVGGADDEPREAAGAGRRAHDGSDRRLRIAGLHADQAGDRVERRIHARAGDEAGAAQVIPELARLHRRGAGRVVVVVGAGDYAVAVALDRGGRRGPARVGVRIVAGNGAVAVLVAAV